MATNKSQTKEDEIIGMKEALELLDVTQPTFYRWIREGKISGNKAGRKWRFRKGDIESFLRGEGPVQDLPSSFSTLVTQLEKVAKEDITSEENKRDIVNYAVCLILQIGVEKRATNIHLEHSGNSKLRFRIDNVLQEFFSFDYECSKFIVQRLKTMSHCNVNINDMPQDGKIKLTMKGNELDVRLTFLPTANGEEAILKLLSSKKPAMMDLDVVLQQEDHINFVKAALSKPYGLHICCGPTGSGKTTTLYGMLKELDQEGKKIITIEDPVEYSFPTMTQIKLRPAKGLNTSAAIRAALRCDPDVIYIGEIKNAETAAQAIDAALTGHVVLTHLHTEDMCGALLRLLDLGISPYLLSDTLGVIVAQRLLRKLCTNCSKSSPLKGDDLNSVKKWAESSGINFDKLGTSWKKSVGCDQCKGTGYNGRIPVNEVGKVTPAISEILVKEENRDVIAKKILAEGIVNLLGEGLRLVAEGKTTLDEIKRVVLTSGQYDI